MESRRHVCTATHQAAGVTFDAFSPFDGCWKMPRYAWQE